MKIRPAHISDCPALGEIVMTATDSAFAGRVPAQCLAWSSPDESANNWAKNFETPTTLSDGDFLYVAEAAAEVVGLAMLCPITTADGYEPAIADVYGHELRSLQIAPAWQRQGVGRALVTHVAAVVQGLGGNALLVRVLVDNPNVPFYERLGAVLLAKRPYVWEGYKTAELIYGWRTLDSLL